MDAFRLPLACVARSDGHEQRDSQDRLSDATTVAFGDTIELACATSACVPLWSSPAWQVRSQVGEMEVKSNENLQSRAKSMEAAHFSERSSARLAWL